MKLQLIHMQYHIKNKFDRMVYDFNLPVSLNLSALKQLVAAAATATLSMPHERSVSFIDFSVVPFKVT